MRRRWLVPAVVWALAGLLGACTGSPVPPPDPTAPGPARTALRCGDAIDVMDSAPPDWTVVLGVLAVPTGLVLQPSPSGESDPAARLFAKQGLVVRVGARVVLRIGDATLGHARIGWGNPGTASDQVWIAASDCSGAMSRWIAFAGGYYVDEPMCLPIVVESGQARQVVYIAVGVACN